jgi:hypothetical protein
MSVSVADAPTGDLLRTRFRRAQDVVGVLLVIGFSFFLCGPILSGRVPVASDTLGLWLPWSQLAHEPIRNATIADSVMLYLSWNQFEREAIREGEWPLWDPYSFAGASFAANSQNQLYYPLTWIRWLMPLSGSIQFLTLFNIWVAGVGTYLLCRHWRLGSVAALIAALAFAGSGMFQLAIELPGVASPYGWLPWILLATDKAMQQKSARWTALAALFCGLELVAGNLQWAIYCYFAAGCWVAWRFGRKLVSDGARPAATHLVPAAMGLAGGLALACVHLVPLFELMGLSNRAGARVSSNSAPLTALLRLLMPEYFGTSVDNVGSPLVFNDLWYVGIPVLLLGVIGLALPGLRERWLWLSMAIFAVFVTYGIGPFLFVRWLPGMSSLLPARIGYLFIFAVALLAGYGFDGWARACRRFPRRAIVTLATAVALIVILLVLTGLALGTRAATPALAALRGDQMVRAWLLVGLSSLVLASLGVLNLIKPHFISSRRGWQRAKSLSAVALILVLIADLLTLAPGYNSYVLPQHVMPVAPSVQWLRARSNTGRTLSLGIGDQPPTLVPNVQMLYGFQSVSGYDSLHTARYEEYWGAVDPSVTPPAPGTPYSSVFVRPQAYSSTLASLLNVQYVTSASPLVDPMGLQEVYSGEMTIYEKPSSGPRAFIVASAEVLPRREVLARLTADDFDAYSTVLLEGEEAPPVAATPKAAPVPAGEVRIVDYMRNSVTLEVTTPSDGWLVLADQNYPGWTASVDGGTQRVYTANYLLRAVHVTAGNHTVVFRYLPTDYALTLTVSVVTLAGIVLVLLWTGLADRARHRRSVVNSGQSAKQEASNGDG